MKADSNKSIGGSPLPAKKKITIQDFQVKHIVGKGAYGDVFLVQKDGVKYAMKQIVKKKLQQQRKQYQALIEKQMLRCIKHPGIIKLKYAFQDTRKLYFILEYCQSGEFIRFMKQYMEYFTTDIRKYYIAQIVNALEYLHSNGIAHRDIKPQNILLSKEGFMKLIDFGTAQITQCKIISNQFKQNIEKQKQKEEQEFNEKIEYEQDDLPTQLQQSPRKRRSTFVGTSYYICPQLLQNNVCEPPSDLWALGCIIYQLYYLQTPFKDTTQHGVFQKIKALDLSFPKNDIISEEAIDLIKRLLVKNPDERLGSCSRQELNYSNLKKHPYFQGIDIDAIYQRPPPDLGLQKYKMKSEQQLHQHQQSLKQEIQKRIPLIQQKYNSKVIFQGFLQWRRQYPLYDQFYGVLLQNSTMILIECENKLGEQITVEISKNSPSKVQPFSENGFIVSGENKQKNVFKSKEYQKWIEQIQSLNKKSKSPQKQSVKQSEKQKENLKSKQKQPQKQKETV